MAAPFDDDDDEERQKIATSVYKEILTHVAKLVVDQRQIAIAVHELLLSRIKRIPLLAPLASKSTPANKLHSTFRTPSPMRQGYASRALETLKNLVMSAASAASSPSLVPNYPETYKKFLDKNNLVQIETVTDAGTYPRREVKTLGLTALKKLGEPFEKMGDEQSVELPQYDKVSLP